MQDKHYHGSNETDQLLSIIISFPVTQKLDFLVKKHTGVLMLFYVVLYFVVSDIRQMALVRSHACVPTVEEAHQKERSSLINDGKTDTDVVWSTVHKRKLVELVDELTTAGDTCGQLQEAVYLSIPVVPDHGFDRPVTPGILMGSHQDSTSSEKSYRKTGFTQSALVHIHDQHRAFHREKETFLSKSDSCKDLGKLEGPPLSPAIYSCTAVPKNNEMSAATIPQIIPGSSKPISGVVNRPEEARQKALRGSSELWTSVDKTLVEDLFDQLLRSFDDVRVSRPETDRAGSGGSRGSLSDDVTNGLVDGGLWQSVAYKWKSHILLRMRSQQVARRALCRKRPYVDDRKLVQNSAF